MCAIYYYKLPMYRCILEIHYHYEIYNVFKVMKIAWIKKCS